MRKLILIPLLLSLLLPLEMPVAAGSMYLSPGEFVLSLTHSPSLSLDDGLTRLLENGVLTGPEVAPVRRGSLTRALVWRVLAGRYGLWVDADRHPEIPDAPDLAGDYRNARAAMILAGLVSSARQPRERISAREYFLLLDRLERGDGIPLAAEEAPLCAPELISFLEEQTGLSLEKMVWAQFLTAAEAALLKQGGPVSRVVAWRTLCCAFGEWTDAPYGRALPDQGLTGTWESARVTAVELGLAREDTPAVRIFSRAEFREITDRLRKGDVSSLSFPDSGDARRFLEGNLKTFLNIRPWNAVLCGTEALPPVFRERFLAEGWTLNLSSPPPEGGETLAGITYSGRREIQLYPRAMTDTFQHEFGHFMVFTANAVPEVREIWEREDRNAARALLGDYALSSFQELFAEAFVYQLQGEAEERALRETLPWLGQAVEIFCTCERVEDVKPALCRLLAGNPLIP